MEVAALLADPVTHGVVIGALALVVLDAARHKWSAPAAFLMALAGYRVVPATLLSPVARGVPLLEFALVAGMLIPTTRNPALIGLSALMLTYGAAITWNLIRGRRDIDCGCGGTRQPLSWSLVIRNAVLAAAALTASGATIDRPLAWLDAITLVGGVLACYAYYRATDELLRHPRRLLRVEQADRAERIPGS